MATMEEPKGDYYKAKYQELLMEKDKIEHEFGLKRAKFRSMFLECEASLKEEKLKSESAVQRVKDLEEEIASLRASVESVQTAAKLSYETRDEELAAMKVKHVEELASMEHIWKEAVNEARGTTAKHFDEENKRLIAANQKLEQQIKAMKSEEKSEGIMSMVSQAIKRGAGAPPAQDTKAENKDDELSDTLKQEIQALKYKLKDANQRLKIFEAKAAKTAIEGETSTEALVSKVQELQTYLDAERSSRTDLEMFVAVLNTQKGVLQEDADKLRSELHHVCRLLEQEKTDHKDLKETWRKANEQFLEQHMALSWEIEKMRELLTPAQNERLSKEYRQMQARPAHAVKTPTGHSQAAGNSNDDLINFDDSPKKDKILRQSSVDPNDVHLIEKIQSSTPSSNGSVDSPDSSPSKVSMNRFGSLEEGEELQEDIDGVKQDKEHMMRKSASSSDISNEKGIRIPSPAGKSLSQGDVSAVISASGEDAWAVISSPTVAELEKKLHLNETGWSTMKESLTTHPACMMCQNYEKQLQRLQREHLDLKDKKDALMTFAKKEKLELRAEKEKVDKLEKSICKASEDAQNQIHLHAEKENEQQKIFDEIQNDFLSLQEDVHFKLLQLSEDRDKMMSELDSLREENANLKAIQETLRDDQQLTMASKSEADPQVVKDKMEQLQLNATINEQQLRSEIMFLKDRVMAEQFDKESTEKILQSDLDQARQEIAMLKEQLSIQDTGKRKEVAEDENQP
ncbi:rab GTPase-binding effector protein 1-like isoform X2 [Rhopilema esculentum]|uniref:rab GTPase-binding effector protein 1-like isoform X2 n=1 Tax=Rhopilema esculentum TaxID=499914 RepID=UPI0031D36F1A